VRVEMKEVKKIRKVIYVIVLVFLLFMLVGCKSKEFNEELHVDSVYLYQYNSVNDYALGQNVEINEDVSNNYTIEIEENKFYALSMSIGWKYSKSHITNENQYPIIEVYYDNDIQYEIYFNDELIGNKSIIENLYTSKKRKLGFSIEHKFLDSTISTYDYICFSFPFNEIGNYKIKYSTTYFFNGEKRERNGEYSIVTISKNTTEQ